MTCATDFLPDDIQALKALVTAQRGEIEHLKLMIAKLRRMQFGRRSEQLDGMLDQLQLTLEELQVSQAALASPPPAQSRPRTPVRRKPLPEHLPREIHVHRPDAQCPGCGGELRHLGDDVAEVLEYVPARFKVIRHVRPKLACRCCDGIVQVPAPSRPISRGLAGPGLLAHVLVSKYVDHLPLYRQSEIYAREGVSLERSTMADWIGEASRLLQPLVSRLRQHIMAANKVHADDTPIAVLAPGQGKTKTGRLWTYVRDERPAGSSTPPAVWFAYSPDRKGEHPEPISGASPGRCKPMAMPVSRNSMPRARFTRRHAGHMLDASFSTCTRHWPRRLRLRPCNGLARYTPSRRKFADSRPINDAQCGSGEPARCWRTCTSGLITR